MAMTQIPKKKFQMTNIKCQMPNREKHIRTGFGIWNFSLGISFIYICGILSIIFAAASCSGNEQANDNSKKVMIDSAFAAQQAMNEKFPQRSKDTLHMLALPPVFEGDIVFQNLDNPLCNHISDIFKSKYNNVA